MQLKALKLAGFKSFLDPTIIPFPSSLVAVVGPNGCGKSNVIDAVRWVMGEGSAKNLRGESMTDVIFNGSTHRKAVGQASVELIFDNSLGRFIGQFGSYQEVVIKRVVTRDGESAYFINGTRCRRKDITESFLGTGAGARGYSIIGQGTITRIIEARPEELRFYLEEAAGVSKYKERRRETLVRITHTRDNLARIADISVELDKQLERLDRQAKAAECYISLKAEERLYKAEILALKWQSLTEEKTRKQQQITVLLMDYEKHQANAAESFKGASLGRAKLQDENSAFQALQSSFYQLATEIVRLEESISQAQKEKQRLKSDYQHMQMDWQTANDQIQRDKELLEVSQKNRDGLQKNVRQLQQEFMCKEAILQDLEESQKEWNNKNQALQSLLNQALRDSQIEEVRAQHTSQRRTHTHVRLENLEEEEKINDSSQLSGILTERTESLAILNKAKEEEEEKYQQVLTHTEILRQRVDEIESELRQAHDEVLVLTTQKAALLATQQTALGRLRKPSPLQKDWYEKSRLAEIICVEKEWQYACEMVMGETLQALVFDSLEGVWPELNTLSLPTALLTTLKPTPKEPAAYPSLLDKVNGLNPASMSLDKIYTADSLEEALSWLPHISDTESIVTPDGYWVAKAWIKMAKSLNQNEEGLLSRQEKLNTLDNDLVRSQSHLTDLKNERNELHVKLKESQHQLDRQRQNLAKIREQQRMGQAEIDHTNRSLLQAKTRENLIKDEKTKLLSDLAELAQAQETIAETLRICRENLKCYEEEQKLLMIEKDKWQEELTKIQQTVHETRAALHQVQLNYDSEQIKFQQLTEQIKWERDRVETLMERMEGLSLRLTELEKPELDLALDLKEKMLKHQELEKTLNLCRDNIQDLTLRVNELEALTRAEEKKSHGIKEQIQQIKMQEQELAVRAHGMVEALDELDVSLQDMIINLPKDITPAIRMQDLQKLEEKIKHMGAINLAAIEEYDVEMKRKQYLDEQQQDLTEALATLESAIEKMDQETLQKLKNTFDAVNIAFQALFPRLFGGGCAMLELTCDNLLEAGILVMAQPPGKRNSTIHLLSGGEKAMTAVALVFAIFQLNPSPFCMLDEVDAPLDDVNIGRFCALVKEMSQFVQFLFITHNKVTMELAEHLIGVTMREPGVSRIVAVDVQQALSLNLANERAQHTEE
jgi:chromosome segregation protein